MKLVFTKGISSFSKLITKVTGEDISHVALLITLNGIEFVIHSNFLGLHIETYPSFLKHSKVLYVLEKKYTEEDVSRALKLLAEYEWSFYDFGAISFLGISLLLRTWFKIPLPKSNLWQSKSMFMCVEWASKYVDLKEESMMTPKRLYYILLGRDEWSIVDG